MAISHAETGLFSAHATAATPSYPVTGLAAGHLFVLSVAAKYSDTVTAPGFTMRDQINAHTGTGVDTGAIRTQIWTRVADGTETGNLALGKTTETGSVVSGRISRYTNATGVWEFGTTTGADTDGGTAYSITGAADPGITGSDVVIAATGNNTDGAGFVGSYALTVPSVTVGANNERCDTGTTSGHDLWLSVAEFAITSGTSTGAPTYDHVQTAGAEGGTVLLRIREGAAASTVVRDIIGIGIVPFAR